VITQKQHFSLKKMKDSGQVLEEYLGVAENG
jgi:hypothetical protein